MTNPFALPGTVDHRQPLCPLEVAEHKNLYVDVDNIGQAFDEFVALFAAPTATLADGRLVVVLGRELCGKTSLINRCSHWLATQSGINVVPIDARQSVKPGQSVDERMRRVARRVIDFAVTRRLVAERVITRLGDAEEHPDDVYSLLGGSLVDNTAVALLLPPATDAPDELVEYARCTSARIVFFLESVYENDIESQLASIRRANSRHPVVLRLGSLSSADGKTFITARLGDIDTAGEFPRMTESDMLKVAEDGPAIGYLQNCLFQVYEQRRLANERYSPLESVTFDELTSTFYRWAMKTGRMGGR